MRISEYGLLAMFSTTMILVLVVLQIFQTRLFPFLEGNPIFLFLSFNYWIYIPIFIIFFFMVREIVNQSIKQNKIRYLKIASFLILGLAVMLIALYLLNNIPINSFKSTLTFLSSNNISTCYTTTAYPHSEYCVYASNYSGVLRNLS